MKAKIREDSHIFFAVAVFTAYFLINLTPRLRMGLHAFTASLLKILRRSLRFNSRAVCWLRFELQTLLQIQHFLLMQMLRPMFLAYIPSLYFL